MVKIIPPVKVGAGDSVFPGETFWLGSLENTPMDPLSLFSSSAGLVRMEFASKRHQAGTWQEKTPGAASDPPNFVTRALTEVAEYLEGGRPEFDLPIDWRGQTAFQVHLRQAARSIPFGRFVPYGELARMAGHVGAFRAAGGAMVGNPLPIIIPCHRVVAANRSLRGYSAPRGLKTKTWLLELEGLTIVNQKLV